jgi:hypothetical protein
VVGFVLACIGTSAVHVAGARRARAQAINLSTRYYITINNN